MLCAFFWCFFLLSWTLTSYSPQNWEPSSNSHENAIKHFNFQTFACHHHHHLHNLFNSSKFSNSPRHTRKKKKESKHDAFHLMMFRKQNNTEWCGWRVSERRNLMFKLFSTSFHKMQSVVVDDVVVVVGCRWSSDIFFFVVLLLLHCSPNTRTGSFQFSISSMLLGYFSKVKLALVNCVRFERQSRPGSVAWAPTIRKKEVKKIVSKWV